MYQSRCTAGVLCNQGPLKWRARCRCVEQPEVSHDTTRQRVKSSAAIAGSFPGVCLPVHAVVWGESLWVTMQGLLYSHPLPWVQSQAPAPGEGTPPFHSCCCMQQSQQACSQPTGYSMQVHCSMACNTGYACLEAPAVRRSPCADGVCVQSVCVLSIVTSSQEACVCSTSVLHHALQLGSISMQLLADTIHAWLLAGFCVHGCGVSLFGPSVLCTVSTCCTAQPRACATILT